MRRFTRLYAELDESNRTGEKVAALERYFTEAPDADAAWALWILTGNRLPRGVNTTVLRQWVAEEAGLPPWLVEECYDTVGDLSETLALLLPERHDGGTTLPLARVIEDFLRPLREMNEETRRETLRHVWRTFDARQRFVFHKLMLGGWRVGVSRTLVVRALANVAHIDKAEMAHRVMGTWEPTAEDYRRLLTGEGLEDDVARPYPFFLASPLEEDPASLGPIDEWQAEWKWDGIRAQVIHRAGEVLVWSRGEELVTDRYPEVAAVGRALPRGTVLDGELLAWRDGQPLPFSVLQRRIGRKSAGRKLLAEAPVAFLAYDLLEWGGVDQRERTIEERRALLEGLVARTKGVALEISPLVEGDDWKALAALRGQSRERGVEGLMLKKRDSPYRVGRVRGDWYKWKIEPFAMDAVMIYAQGGHGRRASLFTDYTFAVWHEGELVPVAKAYSGLTDEEIRRVDSWIKRHTIDRHGPVRVVEPMQVFELHFEGINRSTRHKSGVAVRFPRINRWRTDKKPEEADSLATLKALLPPD